MIFWESFGVYINQTKPKNYDCFGSVFKTIDLRMFGLFWFTTWDWFILLQNLTDLNNCPNFVKSDPNFESFTRYWNFGWFSLELNSTPKSRFIKVQLWWNELKKVKFGEFCLILYWFSIFQFPDRLNWKW